MYATVQLHWDDEIVVFDFKAVIIQLTLLRARYASHF